MPRTTDVSKYPPEFLVLLDRAQLGPVVIPHEAPAGLRGYLQAFLRACEHAGEGSPLVSKAKGTQVTCPKPDPLSTDPARQVPHVLVQRRSDSVYAKRVAAALGQSADGVVQDATADFLNRMGG